MENTIPQSKISRHVPTFRITHDEKCSVYKIQAKTWIGWLPMVLLIWRFPFLKTPKLGWGSAHADWMNAVITPWCKMHNIFICRIIEFEGEVDQYHIIDLNGVRMYKAAPDHYECEQEKDQYVFGEKRNGEWWTCAAGDSGRDAMKSLIEFCLNDPKDEVFTIEKIFERLGV